MIKKINLNKVASYKSPTYVETEKKINLIYGLNGTGKSILSNYLYDKDNYEYKDCSIEGLNEEDILVYNQKFIQDYFFEDEQLKGIFTLSKENKDAEKKIRDAEKIISDLEKKNENNATVLTDMKKVFDKKKESSEKTIWKIKTDYTGGDRIFEYCLENLKGNKSKLSDYISAIYKPDTKPNKTITELKKEINDVQGENVQKIDQVVSINFTQQNIETNILFEKEIVGNKNSTIANLITKLNNSNWVNDGIKYLPQEIETESETCPFCQQKTITKEFINSINDFFNKSYQEDLNKLEELLTEYNNAIKLFKTKEEYLQNKMLIEKKTEFEEKYKDVLKILKKNSKKIESKIKNPSQKIELADSIKTIDEFNNFVKRINKDIDSFNLKIDNKKDTLTKIKGVFWDIMRWEYDQTISIFKIEKSTYNKKTFDTEKSTRENNGVITAQKEIIEEQQKQTVNIDEAIENINGGLIDLGINDFNIIKHSENLYKIQRGDNKAEIFQTLSEGEKMIISFLYFIELCKGKKEASEVGTKKIIVIDDPISSLSHIYIFNIGRLIMEEFLKSDKYEQVFLLTHSLYFFYELTDTNHKRRKENQCLFRIIKNSEGSQITSMKYEEIQNDYQAYWSIIKDNAQPTALIANSMRNIVEYFFNFIEKSDLSNVFQKKSLQNPKYQSFNRYINRESHSLGQNIFDFKEFNYDIFKEALGLLFKENGYEEHYKKMMK
ncbi:MAG: AAA family ATPase [Candidatus Tenebribacter burtonii]|jgi:wobble nucleotide-excising tRNase|nr:AAA family ATPase [Candidatus Tenebribacter burtonii]